MATASLAHRVLYLSSVACLSLLSHSCSKKTTYLNAAEVRLDTLNGILYQDKTAVTGVVFQLTANKQDTVSLVSYSKGVKNGISKIKYETGKLHELRFFKDGKKEGKHIGYWENGRKKFVYNFKNGEYEGPQQKWFETGRKYQLKNYRNGYEEGLQQEWNTYGELVINYEYSNGRQYGNIGKKNCASVWRSDVHTKPGK